MVTKRSKIAFIKPARLAGLVSLYLLLTSINLHAQWRRVLAFPDYFYCIDFLNLPGPPRIGFTTFDDSVFKTTDGGFTWHAVDHYYGLGFAFKDSVTGWYSGFGTHKTTDGGNTWTMMNDTLEVGYYDKKHDGLIAGGGGPTSGTGGIATSWDEGATWSYFNPHNDYVGSGRFSFWNGDTGVLPWWNGANSFYRTMDGGKTWSNAPVNVGYARQVLAIPGTTTAFAMDEFGVVRKTDDLWNSAKVIYQFNVPRNYANPGIFGNLQNMYVVLGSGCYRSTDQGMTWKYLCGISSADFTLPTEDYAKGNRVFIGTYDDKNLGRLWMLNVDSMQYFPTGIQFPGSGKDTTVQPGSAVTVNFVPETSDPIGLNLARLAFRFDSNSLGLADIKLPTGWSILDSSSTAGTLLLDLSADSNVAISNPMVSLYFNTYLTPDPGSRSPEPARIYLDSAYLSGHRLNCDCEALSILQPDSSSRSATDSVQINFNFACGDSLILAAMEHEPPFSIGSIIPNPAQNTLHVTISNPGGYSIRYQLFDELGTERMTGVCANGLLLNTSPLASGIYYLRFSHDGFTSTRSVLIAR